MSVRLTSWIATLSLLSLIITQSVFAQVDAVSTMGWTTNGKIALFAKHQFSSDTTTYRFEDALTSTTLLDNISCIIPIYPDEDVEAGQSTFMLDVSACTEKKIKIPNRGPYGRFGVERSIHPKTSIFMQEGKAKHRITSPDKQWGIWIERGKKTFVVKLKDLTGGDTTDVLTFPRHIASRSSCPEVAITALQTYWRRTHVAISIPVSISCPIEATDEVLAIAPIRVGKKMTTLERQYHLAHRHDQRVRDALPDHWEPITIEECVFGKAHFWCVTAQNLKRKGSETEQLFVIYPNPIKKKGKPSPLYEGRGFTFRRVMEMGSAPLKLLLWDYGTKISVSGIMWRDTNFINAFPEHEDTNTEPDIHPDPRDANLPHIVMIRMATPGCIGTGPCKDTEVYRWDKAADSYMMIKRVPWDTRQSTLESTDDD